MSSERSTSVRSAEIWNEAYQNESRVISRQPKGFGISGLGIPGNLKVYSLGFGIFVAMIARNSSDHLR